ncbi:hypothetical protein XA68_11260 [Ophiocordyceps unilateralis]|uniref:Uncharacterized protein n=1 Tax=Ophiocordyceps unilateralis TaxID=268505 RepID=A0A2A9PH56_OPHUN|nr:hypothetical protein XA68_11260 [Ophiocordyceps unilateralis]
MPKVKTPNAATSARTKESYGVSGRHGISQPASTGPQSDQAVVSPQAEGAGRPPHTLLGTSSKDRKAKKGSVTNSRGFALGPRLRDKSGRILDSLPSNPNGMSDESVAEWAAWLEQPKSADRPPSLTAGKPPKSRRKGKKESKFRPEP